MGSSKLPAFGVPSGLRTPNGLLEQKSSAAQNIVFSTTLPENFSFDSFAKTNGSYKIPKSSKRFGPPNTVGPTVGASKENQGNSATKQTMNWSYTSDRLIGTASTKDPSLFKALLTDVTPRKTAFSTKSSFTSSLPPISMEHFRQRSRPSPLTSKLLGSINNLKPLLSSGYKAEESASITRNSKVQSTSNMSDSNRSASHILKIEIANSNTNQDTIATENSFSMNASKMPDSSVQDEGSMRNEPSKAPNLEGNKGVLMVEADNATNSTANNIIKLATSGMSGFPTTGFAGLTSPVDVLSGFESSEREKGLNTTTKPQAISEASSNMLGQPSPKTKRKASNTIITEPSPKRAKADKIIAQLPADEFASRLDFFRGPEVTVIIGTGLDVKSYQIPKRLLIQASAYFETAIEVEKIGQVSRDIIKLDCSTLAFDLVVQLLYTGTFVSPNFNLEGGPQKITTLMEFYDLTEKFGFTLNISEKVLDVIKELLVADYRVLWPEHIRKAVLLPKGHGLRILFARSCIRTYLQSVHRGFTREFKFKKEFDELDGFVADLMRAYAEINEKRNPDVLIESFDLLNGQRYWY